MKVAIILAAGEGTRMKSSKPKVLHDIAGKKVLSYVIDNCKQNEMDKVVVVVGHKADQVQETFSKEDVVFVNQPIGVDAPYGTGYAVMCATEEFGEEDLVLILTGDTPLFKEETIGRFLDYVEKQDLDGCVLTSVVEEPFGYGRIVRGADSQIQEIVEEKDANDKERAINEVNTGIFAFRGKYLKDTLSKLDTNNLSVELYLTGVVHKLVMDGKNIGVYVISDEEEVVGINSRIQLHQCERIMRKRINEEHMKNGVTFLDAETTLVDSTVEIGRDVVLYPGVILEGNTVIHAGVEIIGNSRIVDSEIGAGSIIDNSTIERSFVGENVTIGPYAHLRPQSVLEDGVHIGNFVEVKNSHLGQGTKAGHLAYIGDADVGERVNIGCGVIFANYNGKNKFRTMVEDDVFIGSNSNLVAPICLSAGSYVAAGSTITRDVEAGHLAIERSEQKFRANYQVKDSEGEK